MSRKVHKFDEKGIYVEDLIIGDTDIVPENCTDQIIPDGLFLPAKFENGEWKTTLTQGEIDEKFNIISTPSELDSLKKQFADLSFELMMNGVI